MQSEVNAREQALTSKKNIIIAHPSASFAEQLKMHLVNEGVNVLGVYVTSEHLLEELYHFKEENKFTVDAIFLSSSLCKKMRDKKLEVFADVTAKIREDFGRSTIIVLSDETANHPLHAELVSLGIYNLIVKTKDKSSEINIKQLINYIDVPMEYYEVKKYKDFDTNISWRKFVNHKNDININIEHHKSGTSHSVEPVADSQERKPKTEEVVTTSKEKPKKSITPKIQQKSTPDFLMNAEEENWILPAAKPKILIQEKIIGKSIIAVTGTTRGVGTTHTAIAIANYLSERGYKVKLLECNGSTDFEKIEQAYHGSKSIITTSRTFEINGVVYVKDLEKEDYISHFVSEHTHYVLDIGKLEKSEFEEEFHRASCQIIVTSGSEWKQHEIHSFIEQHEEIDQSRWNFAVNLVEQIIIKDLKSAMPNHQFIRLGYYPDPFVVDDDTSQTLTQLLDLPKLKNKWMKLGLISMGIILLLLILILLK